MKMIYATGDFHGNTFRFRPQYFLEKAEMSKDVYMGTQCGVIDGVSILLAYQLVCIYNENKRNGGLAVWSAPQIPA